MGQALSDRASPLHSHHWKLLTPNRRRCAVVALRERFGVSERRACRVVGQHRSTQRLDPPLASAAEGELRAWLRAFSRSRPRWGWRRAAKQARREGWVVNAQARSAPVA